MSGIPQQEVVAGSENTNYDFSFPSFSCSWLRITASTKLLGSDLPPSKQYPGSALSTSLLDLEQSSVQKLFSENSSVRQNRPNLITVIDKTVAIY